jgi:hypothetical protein
MKTIKLTFRLVTICFIIYSCNGIQTQNNNKEKCDSTITKNSKCKNDLLGLHLSGKIRYIITTEYYGIDTTGITENGQIFNKTMEIFNKYGNTIAEFIYDSENKLQEYFTYKYNDSEKLLERVSCPEIGLHKFVNL